MSQDDRMSLIEREAYELARENCSAEPPRPCATCLERARVLLDGCTAMDGSPIGPSGAVERIEGRLLARAAATTDPDLRREREKAVDFLRCWPLAEGETR